MAFVFGFYSVLDRIWVLVLYVLARFVFFPISNTNPLTAMFASVLTRWNVVT